MTRHRSLIPDLELRRAESVLAGFCVSRLSRHARHQAELKFFREQAALELFERSSHFRLPGTYVEAKVVRFEYDPDGSSWSLKYRRPGGGWGHYEGFEGIRHLSDLVDEVRRDPRSVFWGRALFT